MGGAGGARFRRRVSAPPGPRGETHREGPGPGRGGGRGRVARRGRRLTPRVSARREQALLRARVVTRDTEAWQRDPAFSGLQRVGGVDVSFVKGDSVRACASLVVLSYPELQVTGAAGRAAPLASLRRLGLRDTGVSSLGLR